MRRTSSSLDFRPPDGVPCVNPDSSPPPAKRAKKDEDTGSVGEQISSATNPSSSAARPRSNSATNPLSSATRPNNYKTIAVSVVVLAVCYGIVQMWRGGRRAPLAGSPEFKDLARKDLGDWTDEDVSHWLVSKEFTTTFVEACLEEGITGEELVSLVLPPTNESTHMSWRPNGLQDKEYDRLEKAVRKLVKWKGQPPPGFWGYRRLHRWHAEMVGTGLLHFPRGMLLYLQWRERNTTLAYLGARSQPLPFIEWRPPIDGLQFWTLWFFAPQLLIVSHSIPYFALSYWVMYVLGLISLSNFRDEIATRWVEYKSARSLSKYITSGTERIPGLLISYFIFVLLWWVVWPWTPGFICRLITRLWIFWKVCWFIVQPMICMWTQRWVSAAFCAGFGAAPLLFDDGHFWDAAIQLSVNFMLLLVLSGFRFLVGRMTPDEFDGTFGRLGELLRPVPCISIKEDTYLQDSIQQLNALPAERLGQNKAVSVVYIGGGGTSNQQEGIDMWGLYRDWLNRSAELLLDERTGAFSKVELNGVEVLRLRKDLDSETAKFVGRLLALSLKAKLALGWRLSEPQARLFLHHQVLGNLQSSTSKWKRARDYGLSLRSTTKSTGAETAWWLSAGFDFRTWIFSTHGEGEAQWLLRCIDNNASPEERTAVLEAIGISFAGGDSHSLEEFVANSVKGELLHEAFRETWRGFHEIPDVKLPKLDLSQAYPRDWQILRNAVLGEEDLDICGWRRHTRINPSQAKGFAVVEWFWNFAETLERGDRFQLFYWWTSLKRLPHGGWSNMQPMTLKITSDTARLPVAHTCFCQMDLPQYASAEALSSKLRQAMHETRFLLA